MPRYDRQQSFSRFGASFRLTRAVKWLLCVNIGVFLLELLIGRFEGGVDFIQNYLCISFDGFFFGGQLWQPVTYMFLHDPFGIGHILWNMLILWMFGSPLESFWGAKGFLKFYFLCGIGAGAMILLTGLLIPSQRASGALFGMMVAFGFLYPNSLIYLFGIFPIKGKHLVMLFVGLSVVQALTLGGTNVSLSAHFGGMLFGFLLVTGWWKPRKAWERIKLWRMKRKYKRLSKKIRVIDRDDEGGGYYH
jgi:membrane associated rhomboid family serine protease